MEAADGGFFERSEGWVLVVDDFTIMAEAADRLAQMPGLQVAAVVRAAVKGEEAYAHEVSNGFKIKLPGNQQGVRQ